MSLSSDNFTALMHLRNQARKWKNIAFMATIVVLLLFFRVFFTTAEKIGDTAKGGRDYIANIIVEGVIFDDDYRNQILRRIAKQENIKAVIVNINSPGGGMVGSEILYENLRKISETKPIVTVMSSLAASGGYMVSIAADYIIARNGTLTGSIGVIMQSSEITDLADKLGIKFTTYKSSKLKGVPSFFEKTNPQADKVINESIKDSYKFFTDLVIERRKDKLDQEEIKTIIDGRVFTGRQALQNGLIDEIGGRDAALKYLQKTHKIDIDKLEVKNISVKESEKRLLYKFFGNDSIAKIFNLNPANYGLMSILN